MQRYMEQQNGAFPPRGFWMDDFAHLWNPQSMIWVMSFLIGKATKPPRGTSHISSNLSLHSISHLWIPGVLLSTLHEFNHVKPYTEEMRLPWGRGGEHEVFFFFILSFLFFFFLLLSAFRCFSSFLGGGYITFVCSHAWPLGTLSSQGLYLRAFCQPN